MKRWAASLLLSLIGCHAPNAPPQWASHPNPPLGLPAPPTVGDNPATPAKQALGRKLFMDRRLSYNNTLSCAMCHIPEQGFSANEVATAVGIEGHSLRRNAPTLLNVAYVKQLFHDGREFSLENQVWGPLLASNEMGNPSVGHVIDKITRMPDYLGLFQTAFNGQSANIQTIGAALAIYQRSLLSGNSRFDRWYYGGQPNALTATEQAGYTVFTGQGHCIACHQIGAKSALFADGRFHNTGIGWAASMGQGPASHTIELAPGVQATVDDQNLSRISETPQPDVGRYEITQDLADRWAYRTPSLRNIALTAPYMHDGTLRTLEQVIAFYDRGGIDNPTKDPLLQPLHLTTEQKHSLRAFLGTLTGDNLVQLQHAARAEPINQPIAPRAPVSDHSH
jgi:cytochrome c peroxidase